MEPENESSKEKPEVPVKVIKKKNVGAPEKTIDQKRKLTFEEMQQEKRKADKAFEGLRAALEMGNMSKLKTLTCATMYIQHLSFRAHIEPNDNNRRDDQGVYGDSPIEAYLDSSDEDEVDFEKLDSDPLPSQANQRTTRNM